MVNYANQKKYSKVKNFIICQKKGIWVNVSVNHMRPGHCHRRRTTLLSKALGNDEEHEKPGHFKFCETNETTSTHKSVHPERQRRKIAQINLNKDIKWTRYT